MRAAAVVAGVFPQFEEFLDVEVPGFKIRAHRAFAFAALINGHGRVIDDFQERHHTLRFAVGALDMGAERAHRRPVVADAPRILLQHGIFLDRLVNAVKVVRHCRQIATGKLRAARRRVKQGRRRTHEVERRQHIVEFDRARFALVFGFV